MSELNFYLVCEKEDAWNYEWYAFFGTESEVLAFADDIPCHGDPYEHVFKLVDNGEVAYFANEYDLRQLIKPSDIGWADIPSDIFDWYMDVYFSEKNDPKRIPI